MPPSLNLAYPFTGRWLTQNSPAYRVPSHGTTRYAASYAMDFVSVDDAGGTAPSGFARSSVLRKRRVSPASAGRSWPRSTVWSSRPTTPSPTTTPSAECHRSAMP